MTREDLKETLEQSRLTCSIANMHNYNLTDQTEESQTQGLYDFTNLMSDEILTLFYNNEAIPDEDLFLTKDILSDLLFNLLKQANITE